MGESRALKFVTYDPITNKAAVVDGRHDDVSALGLNVVAVVNLCRAEEDCAICTALRRRMAAITGNHSAKIKR